MVASTESDGSVHLVCGDKAASFPSPILQKLYAVPEDSDEKAGTKRKMDEGGGGDAKATASQETDLLTLQPWRRQLLTTARELIQAFDERQTSIWRIALSTRSCRPWKRRRQPTRTWIWSVQGMCCMLPKCFCIFATQTSETVPCRFDVRPLMRMLGF